MTTDPTTTLDDFEGQQVLAVGIEIPGAAGGLREALNVDPVQLHKGDVAYVLLKTTTGKIRFDPVKDTQGLRRVHILEVEEGMLVDGALVDEHLAGQRARIAEAKLAKEAAEKGGVIQFPTDEELLEAHEAGEHAAALVEGCVECQKEIDAEAAEVAADGSVAGEVTGDGSGEALPPVEDGADEVTQRRRRRGGAATGTDGDS